jgi:hypothetical protein
VNSMWFLWDKTAMLHRFGSRSRTNRAPAHPVPITTTEGFSDGLPPNGLEVLFTVVPLDPGVEAVPPGAPGPVVADAAAGLGLGFGACGVAPLAADELDVEEHKRTAPKLL